MLLSLNYITCDTFWNSKHVQQIFLDLWPLYKVTPSGMIWLPVCCLWRSISLCWLLISISSNQTLLFRSSTLYDPTNFLLSLLCFSVATASTEHPISLHAGRKSLGFHWECDGLRVCAPVCQPPWHVSLLVRDWIIHKLCDSVVTNGLIISCTML